MPEVTVLRHRDRLAAVPVANVQSVLRALPDDARMLNLWPGKDEAHTQFACCSVGGALRRYIPCASAVVTRLKRDEVWPLSELISQALGRDYIVGFARQPQGVVWLIDLAQVWDD